MADLEQLEQLKQGVEAWNEWRSKNPTVPIDLSEADHWRTKQAKPQLAKR